MSTDEAPEKDVLIPRRRLDRLYKFVVEANRNIPALIRGDRDSAEYRIAVAWWESTQGKVIPGPGSPE